MTAVALKAIPEVAAAPGPAHETKKYAFIDALRGYAVLLVITHHTASLFAQLPYPVRKLTNVGWHGVQLFFLVSCVTLMMSWRSDERKGIASPAGFWARRFFRISPMYYLAALFYFLVDPPAAGFDLKQLLASVGFVNAWHPALIPTIPNSWTVVPGGWSIGVEFSFYLLFPIIVLTVRTGRKAAAFFFVAVAMACATNSLAHAELLPRYGRTATENFLYFWLPNQLPIFALGTILFFLIERLKDSETALANSMRGHALLIILGCAAVFTLLAECPVLPATFSAIPLRPIPQLEAESLMLLIFSLTLALNRQSIFVNKPICELGKVSFSAYLLHFFVLQKLVATVPFIDIDATNYAAIGSFLLLWAMVLPSTFILSKITYETVEKPMITAGSFMADKVRGKANELQLASENRRF